MGYGVRIKDPKFDGIGFDYKGDDFNEQLMIEKAKLCSLILKKDKPYNHINNVKIVINTIKQLLIIKFRKQYESWVEDGKLYIDHVKQGESKYSLEDSTNTFESFVEEDLSLLYIAALSDTFYFTTEYYKNELCNSDIYDILDRTRVLVNKIISEMEENVEVYVGNKIALLNFDNIINDEE